MRRLARGADLDDARRCRAGIGRDCCDAEPEIGVDDLLVGRLVFRDDDADGKAALLVGFRAAFPVGGDESRNAADEADGRIRHDASAGGHACQADYLLEAEFGSHILGRRREVGGVHQVLDVRVLGAVDYEAAFGGVEPCRGCGKAVVTGEGDGADCGDLDACRDRAGRDRELPRDNRGVAWRADKPDGSFRFVLYGLSLRASIRVL